MPRIGERLEKASPHNLETFLGTGRPPGRVDTPNDVPQPIEGLPPAVPTDLDVIRLGVGGPGRVRGWQADHEQAVVGEFGRFREYLGKTELGLEAAGGEVALVMQLASVGHPLVDEDQAVAVFIEEFQQCIAWTRRLFVVGRDARERLLATQLPRQLAPKCSYDRAIRFGDRVPRGNLVPHQHDPARRRQLLGLRFLQHGGDPVQLSGGRPGEQVIQRQHGVGLTAAEVRLELNDRVSASAREAADGPHQQPLQAFRQIRAPEELDGVSILVCAFTQMHLPEIGGELGLLVAPARDVPVGGDDFPPWLQAGRGGAVNRRSRLLAPFSARLFVEAYPQQFQLALLELFGLRRGDRGKESAHRIQRAIGVIAGKTLLVCPLVAVAA